MARFYETDPGLPALDYDVCLEVRPRADGSIPDTVAEARGELIPLHHALQTVLRGSLGDRHDAWRALEEARRALGYAAAGPVTEVYACTGHGREACVTEVRLPYAR